MKDEKKTELKDEKLEKVTGGVDTGLNQNGKQPESAQRSENCSGLLQGSGASGNAEQNTVDINGLEIIGPYPYS